MAKKTHKKAQVSQQHFCATDVSPSIWQGETAEEREHLHVWQWQLWRGSTQAMADCSGTFPGSTWHRHE